MSDKLWYPCCEHDDTPPCNKCSSDADTVSITYAGFVMGQCACGDLNGTFVLTRSSTDACRWIYTGTITCISGTWPVEITAWAVNILGKWGWYIQATIATIGHYVAHVWKSAGTTAFDCTATRTATYYTHLDTSGFCLNYPSVTCQVN